MMYSRMRTEICGRLAVTVVMMICVGCGGTQSSAPPPLPELATPIPDKPSPPEPLTVENTELRLYSTEGEEIDEVPTTTVFKVVVQFQLPEPPKQAIPRVYVRLITYIKNVPTIGWETLGTATVDQKGVYRFEGELRSPPETKRQFFVQVELGKQNLIAEKEIKIRNE